MNKLVPRTVEITRGNELKDFGAETGVMTYRKGSHRMSFSQVTFDERPASIFLLGQQSSQPAETVS